MNFDPAFVDALIDLLLIAELQVVFQIRPDDQSDLIGFVFWSEGDAIAITAGDQIELYQPRQKPTEGRDLALPEISIGRAQVLRVTEYGATAIVISQAQPKIEQGAAVRIAAKMP